MSTIVMAGALDTKGPEYDFARRQLQARGLSTLLIDVGTGSPRCHADISASQVASKAGAPLASVRRSATRAEMLDVMAHGLTRLLSELHQDGRLDAVFGMGGSGAIAALTPAFAALPIGVPKVIVTTMAGASTGPAMIDILLIPAIVDIAGLNALSRLVIERAAATLKAQLETAWPSSGPPGDEAVALSLFGITTSAGLSAQARLQALGHDVLAFHANGTGGRTLESLAADGWVRGVLDLTTTELADHLVGGVASAGSERLVAAGARGIAQVVAPGALDTVNFGPRETVPPQFRDRTLYQHSATATLMRTSPSECRALGHLLAARLNAATGPVTVLLPREGLSALSVRGGPFYSPDADEALIVSLVDALAATITVVHSDVPLNTPEFGEQAADLLARLL
ncbi:Tm-1-like ATP-binding domain-containing protein [Streptomyces spiralis]|uniref:Tm-1-like ATP-binding domain-containing protein n=1 Tax=Streptomyces spiralis TaxID=66376 RepID=UPI0036AD4E2E